MFAFEIRCIPSALFILRVRGLLWRVSCALCAVLYYLPIVSHSLTQEQLATILLGSETEMSPKLLKHLLNTLYLRITDVKILSPFWSLCIRTWKKFFWKRNKFWKVDREGFQQQTATKQLFIRSHIIYWVCVIIQICIYIFSPDNWFAILGFFMICASV